MAYIVSKEEQLSRTRGIGSDEELNKNLTNDSYAADDTLKAESVDSLNDLGSDGFNKRFGN